MSIRASVLALLSLVLAMASAPAWAREADCVSRSRSAVVAVVAGTCITAEELDAATARRTLQGRPDDYNLKLTQDRVDSVMSAMVSRGVDRTRLRSKGYGEYCPANPGHNDAAWEENRRVEFKVVKTKDGPTGVELGCANAGAHGVRALPVPP